MSLQVILAILFSALMIAISLIRIVFLKKKIKRIEKNIDSEFDYSELNYIQIGFLSGNGHKAVTAELCVARYYKCFKKRWNDEINLEVIGKDKAGDLEMAFLEENDDLNVSESRFYLFAQQNRLFFSDEERLSIRFFNLYFFTAIGFFLVPGLYLYREFPAYYIFLLLVLIIIASLGGGKNYPLTSKGQKILDSLESEHSDLKTICDNPSELEPGQMGLAVALYGEDALTHSDFVHLREYLYPSNNKGGGAGGG